MVGRRDCSATVPPQGSCVEWASSGPARDGGDLAFHSELD